MANGARVIETSGGKVRGTVEDGLHVFRGIAYGRIAGPEGRWRAPQPATWAGVRESDAFGPSSPQVRRGKPDRPTPVGSEPYAMPQSEDCLTLNIWTPALDADAAQPVMIWLHGGGFSSGSASSPVFSGAGLAGRGDTVFVSVNHRLGALGFLYIEDADANAGLLDLVAALRWIQDNIAAFGGDPRRVMVFGESGGGQKVCALMAMPSAEGLFSAAAIQSGATIRMNRPETGIELRDRVAAILGVAARVQDLRLVDADRLVAAASEASRAMPARAPGFANALMPVVDGLVLPRHPFEDGAPDCSAHVPLLIGYNKTEATYFHRLGYGPNDRDMDDAELHRRLAPVLGADSRTIIAAFAALEPDLSPWQRYVRIFTEFPSGMFVRMVADSRASAMAPTFIYRFDWETPISGGILQSPHMIEIPFVLNNLEVAGPLIGADATLPEFGGRVSAAWRNLAATGTPRTESMDHWPDYDTSQPKEMRIDQHSHVASPEYAELDPLFRAAAALD